MGFELSDEQEAIRGAAAEFAKGEFDRHLALECERSRSFPTSLWRKCGELGFLGLHYPESCGGQGCGVLENVLVTEAFCRQDSGLGMAISHADSCSEMILRFGDEAQQARFLAPLAAGKAISSGAFTEPDHGSDLTRVETTATPSGDGFAINGSKMFITNGCMADFVFVLCRTSGPSARGQGQSILVVERASAGFTASEVGEKMGNRMTSSAGLHFKDCRVPASNLIGQAGQGFAQALQLFQEVRIEIAAQALGVAQGAFDRALAYVQQRSQFGRTLAQFQVTRHKLADMLTKVETARLLVYRAAWSFDQGRCDAAMASMAKSYAARVALEVADEAIQLLGGYGCMLEYEVERFYRDARAMEIFGGTREVQKNTIARHLLGSASA